MFCKSTHQAHKPGMIQVVRTTPFPLPNVQNLSVFCPIHEFPCPVLTAMPFQIVKGKKKFKEGFRTKWDHLLTGRFNFTALFTIELASLSILLTSANQIWANKINYFSGVQRPAIQQNVQFT